MTQPLAFRLARVPSPVGTMLIATDDQDRLRALDWEDYAERMDRLLQRHYGDAAVLKSGSGAQPVTDRIAAYLSGDIAAIDGIITETGGTAFQKAIWAGLRQIPAGKTWSYSDLARHIGNPPAVRAVGLANGSNPISVVVPCHRVIGASGALTGYAGGIERKRWLLRHEGLDV